MLTRLIARGDVVREHSAEYNVDGEYEYRDAEYEAETLCCQSNWMQWSRNSCGGLLASFLVAH